MNAVNAGEVLDGVLGQEKDILMRGNLNHNCVDQRCIGVHS